MKRRRLLAALLALALPLIACGGVDKMTGEEAAAKQGRALCVRGCREVDLSFDSYHDPNCWCDKDGERIRLW